MATHRYHVTRRVRGGAALDTGNHSQPKARGNRSTPSPSQDHLATDRSGGLVFPALFDGVRGLDLSRVPGGNQAGHQVNLLRAPWRGGLAINAAARRTGGRTGGRGGVRGGGVSSSAEARCGETESLARLANHRQAHRCTGKEGQFGFLERLQTAGQHRRTAKFDKVGPPRSDPALLAGAAF